MANDMQWPSEDEDFDAVTTAPTQTIKPVQAVKPVATAKPVKTVAVDAPEPVESAEPPVEAKQTEPKSELDPVDAAFTDEPEHFEEPAESPPEEVDPVEAAFADEPEEIDPVEAAFLEEPVEISKQKPVPAPRVAPTPRQAPTPKPITISEPATDSIEPVEQESASEPTPEPQQKPEPQPKPQPKELQLDTPIEHIAPVITSQKSAAPAQPIEPAKSFAVATSPKEPRSGGSAVRTVFEAILVLALLGLAFFAYTLHKDKQQLASQTTDLNSQIATLKSNPQLAVQKQTDELIAKVGALMTLPAGETPTVANVSDVVKARQQSNFFANAQNGDRVLLYAKAGKAILYRPDTNKVVIVAPLTFNNDTTTGSTTPGTSATTNAKSSR